jgi:hypothetical protein
MGTGRTTDDTNSHSIKGFWRVIAATLVWLSSCAPYLADLDRSSKSGSGSLYRVVDRLIAGLPELDRPPELEMPQAALENFILSAERGDFARAAHSLNLISLPTGRQELDGPALARKFREVLDQQVWFKWSEVPGRPDGQIDGPSLRGRAGVPTGPQDNTRL